MLQVYLGLSFASPLLPTVTGNGAGQHHFDYPGLVHYLSGYYGLPRSVGNQDVLRTEQYRQLVKAHLGLCEREPFYRAAFVADAVATAEDLLSRRDELLAGGYRLHTAAEEGAPARIVVLHELESMLLGDPDRDLLPGFADQLVQLIAAVRERRHPGLHLHVHEPRQLLPSGLQRLLDALVDAGDRLTQLAEPSLPTGQSDLHRWQRTLHGLLGQEVAAETGMAKGDGSLVLLRAERETHLAAYLARTLRENPTWKPSVLLCDATQALDTALRMEGLPSMGVPSTSLARPSLQVLKLVTAFLWEPTEVQRVMEFLSLVTKPLDRYLAQQLAVHLADTPGLFGARWTFTVEQAFRDMEERNYPAARRRRAREQYDFWFRRRRYPREGTVPKGEVRSIFVFLRNWALEAFDEDNGQQSLLVLAAQAERATELLDTRPSTELNYLDVERLVRTVYQPAPAQFAPAEVGAPGVALAPGAVVPLPTGKQKSLNELIWWDFVDHDPAYFFSRYYPPEVAYLERRGCHLRTAEQRNQLLVWQYLRPALHTREQLVLCLPTRIRGELTESHPLLGDLQAAFGEAGLDALTLDIDRLGRGPKLLPKLSLPAFAPVPLRLLDRPAPHLSIADPRQLGEREHETPTALEDLLYYPHKWALRHQLGLRGTPILSIASENRLRGNLSHFFTERLLGEIAESGRAYDRGEVEAWIDEQADNLLLQQGAVLLEYGQEPERIQFILTIKKSAWTLVNFIQQNGWRIVGSEQEVVGELTAMGGQSVRGRADLILERESAAGRREICVVDLKWRGKTVFTNLLRNAEDIQLCLYSEFLQQRQAGTHLHTAYYLLRDARMLARNELAFAGATTVSSEEKDHVAIQKRTLTRIRATHDWRRGQLAEGLVEVRCDDTLGELEDLYLQLDHDSLLEMKTESARFDDYRSLIGLVR